MIGKQFNRWTVLAEGQKKYGKIHWICQCVCGAVGERSGSSLIDGHSKSCGCLRIDNPNRNPYTTHGMSRRGRNGSTPEYRAWCRMKSDCYRPTSKSYSYYGGRGITVCKRWRNDFAEFYRDLGPRPSPRHSLGRINNNRGYRKDNCRWETVWQQARNTGSVKLYRWRNQLLSLAEIARLPECVVYYRNLYDRVVEMGWPLKKAVLTPSQKRKEVEGAKD